MRTIKLWVTGSATANNAANIIVPGRATLRGVQVALRINSITDGAQLDLELSRASAREIQVNSSQQCILQVCYESNFVTSGLAQGGLNQFFPCSCPLEQGQMIYAHALIAGTVIYDATFILHFA